MKVVDTHWDVIFSRQTTKDMVDGEVRLFQMIDDRLVDGLDEGPALDQRMTFRSGDVI